MFFCIYNLPTYYLIKRKELILLWRNVADSSLSQVMKTSLGRLSMCLAKTQAQGTVILVPKRIMGT